MLRTVSFIVLLEGSAAGAVEEAQYFVGGDIALNEGLAEPARENERQTALFDLLVLHHEGEQRIRRQIPRAGNVSEAGGKS